MRLLVVEDDARTGSFVVGGLRQEGHVVDWSRDGDEGLRQLATERYDAAIVDLALPERGGIRVVREGRRRGIDTPLLVLSPPTSVNDRVAGLEAGADDCLPKPFAFVELSARVLALARRAARASSPAALRPDVLRYHDVEMDLRARRVRRAGRPVALRPKEHALLECFLRNPERVLTKTMLLDRVWEVAFDPQTNVVDVLVHRLRKQIDAPFDRRLIQTVRGAGYVLRID